MKKAVKYGRRSGDLVVGKAQVILEIKTPGLGTYLVGYAHETSLETIGQLIRHGIDNGMTLKLDDEQHIILSAEMVKGSVFIVRNGTV